MATAPPQKSVSNEPAPSTPPTTSTPPDSGIIDPAHPSCRPLPGSTTQPDAKPASNPPPQTQKGVSNDSTGFASIVQRIEELDSDGPARTTMTDLEIGFSARNADEWDRLVGSPHRSSRRSSVAHGAALRRRLRPHRIRDRASDPMDRRARIDRLTDFHVVASDIDNSTSDSRRAT